MLTQIWMEFFNLRKWSFWRWSGGSKGFSCLLDPIILTQETVVNVLEGDLGWREAARAILPPPGEARGGESADVLEEQEFQRFQSIWVLIIRKNARWSATRNFIVSLYQHSHLACLKYLEVVDTPSEVTYTLGDHKVLLSTKYRIRLY